MDLVIDIGNSKAKIALYDEKTVVERFCFDQLALSDVASILASHPDVDQAIVSTTRRRDLQLEFFLTNTLAKVVLFDPATTRTPLCNCYRTPHTLGGDRFAAAVAAWNRFPGCEIVIFDFGTALTIDRVNAAGEYLGGNISLGMAMRFMALNNNTDCLPLCNADNYSTEDRFGTDTYSAIMLGVTGGILMEVEGYIAYLTKQNPQIKIFFTGGDALYFEKRIKNTIFVEYDAVLNGLHLILNY
ncbi:MAG: type III pantothenate kinase [Mucinivorans sp.]